MSNADFGANMADVGAVVWTLDVVFAQDASRIRTDSSPEIASMLRQLALMILQQDTRLSGSLRC